MKRVILALATAAGAAYLLKRRRSQRAQHAHDIEGKVALITGSSRGLGFVLAQQLAERGARVALCARDEDELTQARERIAGDGGDVIALRCDVSDRSQVQRTVSETAARLGPIDILVNNAGIITVGPLESQTVEDFREAMDIMYWGTVYSTLEVLPEMRRRRSGHIVNITSIGGKVSVPHLLPYNAAKFAAVGFSEGLHAEEAGNGIHVLTVVPGLMRTGSHVNASFKGDNRGEFRWFSLGASLPVTSIDAQSAARQIIEAIVRGDSELIITPQAHVLARAHGLMPGLTTSVISVVDRLLPKAGSGQTEGVPGKDSESAVSRSFLTELGRRAAGEYQQEDAGGARSA